jgi:hypothetical protein
LQISYVSIAILIGLIIKQPAGIRDRLSSGTCYLRAPADRVYNHPIVRCNEKIAVNQINHFTFVLFHYVLALLDCWIELGIGRDGLIGRVLAIGSRDPGSTAAEESQSS